MTGDYTFASELGSLSGNTIPMEFEIEPGSTLAQWATTSNVEGLLVVTFTGGVLDRSLVDADIVGTGACGANALLTVDANGAAGQSTVTFRISDLQSCDGVDRGIGGDNAAFAFPVLLNGNAVNVAFELRRASNNALITSGSWNGGLNNGAPLGNVLVNQSSAVALDVTPGTAVAAAPAYTSFATSSLGQIAVDTVGTVLLADGSGVSDAVISDFDISCQFGSVTGLDQNAHGLGAYVNQATGNTTNPVNFDGASTDFTGANATLTLVALGAGGILPQNVTCTPTYNFTPASGLADGSGSAFFVGNIRRQGQTSNKFEWTGGANAVTRSIFRMTGFGATAPTATVILSNSNTGVDGEYPITLPAPSNGEIIVTNSMIASAVGSAFGRADVQFSLATIAPGATDIVVRRLLVGSNGTLTDFGNENEDSAGATSPAPVAPSGTIGGGQN